MTPVEKVMREALERARKRGPGAHERFEIHGLKRSEAFAALEALEREPDVYKARQSSANHYWIELRP